MFSQAIQSIFPFLLSFLPLLENYSNWDFFSFLFIQLLHLYLTTQNDRCVYSLEYELSLIERYFSVLLIYIEIDLSTRTRESIQWKCYYCRWFYSKYGYFFTNGWKRAFNDHFSSLVFTWRKRSDHSTTESTWRSKKESFRKGSSCSFINCTLLLDYLCCNKIYIFLKIKLSYYLRKVQKRLQKPPLFLLCE